VHYTNYFSRLQIAVNGSVPQTFSVATDSRLNWAGETTVLLGCLTLGVLVLLGISSSPSVSATYSWREFRCCFSSVGFLALILAATHVTVYGAYHWYFTANVKGIVLSMSMVTLFLPWLTIVLRFIMAMPCISRQLTRIRHGYVRRDPLPRSFHNRVNHVDVTDNTLKLTETI
jgi:metalloreductase STEAP2